jgi:hypothetical protein
MSPSNKIKLVGFIIGILSAIVLICGIIITFVAPNCGIKDTETEDVVEKCEQTVALRKTGVILMLSGAFGILLAAVLVLWKYMLHNNVYLSMIATIAACIAAVAAATSATASANAATAAMLVGVVDKEDLTRYYHDQNKQTGFKQLVSVPFDKAIDKIGGIKTTSLDLASIIH